MSLSRQTVFVLSIDQSKIKEADAGSYKFKVMLSDIKARYSKFAASFTEYSIEINIIAAPIENKTEAVEEEVVEEPEVKFESV